MAPLKRGGPGRTPNDIPTAEKVENRRLRNIETARKSRDTRRSIAAGEPVELEVRQYVPPAWRTRREQPSTLRVDPLPQPYTSDINPPQPPTPGTTPSSLPADAPVPMRQHQTHQAHIEDDESDPETVKIQRRTSHGSEATGIILKDNKQMDIIALGFENLTTTEQWEDVLVSSPSIPHVSTPIGSPALPLEPAIPSIQNSNRRISSDSSDTTDPSTPTRSRRSRTISTRRQSSVAAEPRDEEIRDGDNGNMIGSSTYRQGSHIRALSGSVTTVQTTGTPVDDAECTQVAVQAIICCITSNCPCTNDKQKDRSSTSLRDVSQFIRNILEQSDLLHAHPNAPLALPKLLSAYENPPEWLNWRALLTGYGLDPSKPTEPPLLDFNLSQEQHLSTVDQHTCDLGFEFDIDSVIFLASSLGVFRHDVEWSFRPSFMQSKQQNQRVKFPGINMTEDKCMLACTYGRWNCHIFFSNMPRQYTTQHGALVVSNSQHLDDYAMEIWTDRILLPALGSVCSNGRRHHYPHSFREIQTKSNIQSEILVEGALNNRVDTRNPIPAHLLSPFWSKIYELCDKVYSTQLPLNAFAEPKIVISNHNMKLSGIRKTQFGDMRRAYKADIQQRWDEQYIDKQHYWNDLGLECFSTTQTGTTILRKAACNIWWADQFLDPYTKSRDSVNVTTFPWAGTQAGSITVDTKQHNHLRRGGLGYSKAYNVVKEQHASQIKGLHPFQDPLLEAMAYSDEHLGDWSKIKKGQGRWPDKLSPRLIQKHLQNVKHRVLVPLETTDDCCFGKRKEFRITYDLLFALPEDLGTHVEESFRQCNTNNLHPNYWVLSTRDVNQFRIAEANRWLVTLESVAAAAKAKPGTNQTLPLAQQEVNSLMSTAMARLLRLSLGCLNPTMFPELWLGKRWVKSRFSNKVQDHTLQEDRVLQRRQGLNIRCSVEEYGMMWIPLKLAIWDLALPMFRVGRYPHLDVNVNIIRASLRVSTSDLKATTREGKIREFTRNRIQKITTHSQANDQAFIALCDILAQMCVQAYNLVLWEEITSRWITQANQEDAYVEVFEEVSKRSQLSKDGLEVVSYETLDMYLGNSGAVAIDMFNIAFAKNKNTSTHFPSWTSNTWIGRIYPLFCPAAAQPNWAKRTRHVKKYEEIVAMLLTSCPTEHNSYIKMFKKRLFVIAPRYMRAILHYDYDKGITVAKASKHNSQQVQDDRRTGDQLSRTKWMFPRFADEDIKQYDIRHGRPQKGHIDVATANRMAIDWRVLTESDRQYKPATLLGIRPGYPPTSMVHGGSHISLPDTLTELINYLHEIDEWIYYELEHGVPRVTDDSGDDTDWPPRPIVDRHSAELHDEVGNIDD